MQGQPWLPDWISAQPSARPYRINMHGGAAMAAMAQRPAVERIINF
jgi:hypothetical protein